MGVGAALIMPATLSIITNVFPREERGKAIGIWAGMAAIGIGLGPLFGGLLLERFSWTSLFSSTSPSPPSPSSRASPSSPKAAIRILAASTSSVPGSPSRPSWRSCTASSKRPIGAGRVLSSSAVSRRQWSPSLRSCDGNCGRLSRCSISRSSATLASASRRRPSASRSSRCSVRSSRSRSICRTRRVIARCRRVPRWCRWRWG